MTDNNVGDPGPRPHRCNDRIEDLLQARAPPRFIPVSAVHLPRNVKKL